jgi:mRNA interferase HicA
MAEEGAGSWVRASGILTTGLGCAEDGVNQRCLPTGGRMYTCATSSPRSSSRMAHGTSRTAPRYPAPMVRAKRGKNAWRTSARRLPLFLSIDERNHCALCPPMRGRNSSWLDEARRTASAPSSCVLPREGKEHTLWENPQTGHAEAIPRHAEIANLLARKICRKLSIPDPPG